MAHVAKYTKSATGLLCRHYERKKDENDEYVKFGNQDIDTSKSHFNYNLAPERDCSQVNFIRNRCSEVKCQNRDDVKVMCSWIITLPKNFFDECPDFYQKHFFKQSYEFLEKKYGKENVISSYVHLDETTPHMHFAFVPVVKDKKKDIYKVSAKELLTKKELQEFHPKLQKHLQNYFALEVPILNGNTKNGNKTVAELKKDTTTYEEQLQNTLNSLKNAQNRLDLLKQGILSLENKNELLKVNLGSYDNSRITAEPQTTFFGELKGYLLSPKDFERVSEVFNNSEQTSHQAQNYKMQYEKLQKYVEDGGNVKEKMQQAEREAEYRKDISSLERKISSLERQLNGQVEKNNEYVDIIQIVPEALNEYIHRENLKSKPVQEKGIDLDFGFSLGR